MVALTGSIGSGKSTIAGYLKALGAETVDADELAREVVIAGSAGLKEIIQQFGSAIIDLDGSLNRYALGQIVFNDPSQRKLLEGIVHPLIRKRWLQTLEKLNTRVKGKVIVYVVPLFFESGADYQEIKKTIVVYASDSTCLTRTVNRDGLSEENARNDLLLNSLQKKKQNAQIM